LLLIVQTADATIAVLKPGHWPEVASVYADGIATGDATFETEVPSWDHRDGGHLADHRFVALRNGSVVGWVAAGGVSDRCVYAGVVEHSVYVAARDRGHGVGAMLLDRLFASTEAAGIWTIQTGIFPENEPSLRLHERAGFRAVGRRERLAKHSGVWRDVLMLERRSTHID
jgi:phosphinothricin acetyltransferase